MDLTLTPDQILNLQAATYKTVPKFSFNGLKIIGKSCKVYDGDSCWALFYFNGALTKCAIRMYGYDTPEMRSPSQKEVAWAHIAKARLKELIDGNIVAIHFVDDSDKYGRQLANLYIMGDALEGTDHETHITDHNAMWDEEHLHRMVHINQLMIDEGYGVPYQGGTKPHYEDMNTYPMVSPKKY